MGEGRRGKGRKGDSKLMCGLSTHSRRVLTSLPWMGNGPLLLWNETHQVRGRPCVHDKGISLPTAASTSRPGKYKELFGFIMQTIVKGEGSGDYSACRGWCAETSCSQYSPTNSPNPEYGQTNAENHSTCRLQCGRV